MNELKINQAILKRIKDAKEECYGAYARNWVAKTYHDKKPEPDSEMQAGAAEKNMDLQKKIWNHLSDLEKKMAKITKTKKK